VTATLPEQTGRPVRGEPRAQDATNRGPGLDQIVGADVVLITGCSTGIGRATARMLSTAGYRVVATARHPETLDGLGAAMTLALDVADEASIDTAVRAVLDRYGRIDVLVNNAGYSVRGAVDDVDLEPVARMFDVNVLGIIRMIHRVAPVMRGQGSGRVVNIGSMAGKFLGPANGTYAATKHAVEALSDAMRWELEPFGVEVILVEPGAIRTNFEATVAAGSHDWMDRTDSPYGPLYARLAATNARIRASEPGPEVVARVIQSALASARPHPRYPAAIPFLARIVMRLPDVGKDIVVRRLYGLGARGRSERPPSLSRKERVGLWIHRESDKRMTSVGVALYRLTKGRITPGNVDALLLTTQGRKSGRKRTVILQFFRDGDDLVLAAANDGGSSHPSWYYNLKAAPAASVEVMGRRLSVRAEEMSEGEAAAFWPRLLRRAPSYERYQRATRRTFPLVRLVAQTKALVA
jgi:deazaflavin-dependent oxidoreductase (nitroreductase family)